MNSFAASVPRVLGSGILTGFPVPQCQSETPSTTRANEDTTGLSKEVFLGGQDRLTRVQVLFTRKPTPHRSSVFSHRIIATTTKICTRKTIHAGSRHALRLVPCALLHGSGFELPESRRTIGDLLEHRPFSGLVHSAGELLHTP